VDGISALACNQQSAGRGTQGRVWASPAGCGVYLSVVVPASVLPPATLAPDYPWTPLIGGLVADWLASFGPMPQAFYLKPVNDLMIGDPQALTPQVPKKLGGILVERLLSAASNSATANTNEPDTNDPANGCWIVGVGLNVHLPTAQLPPELPTRAISLTEAWPTTATWPSAQTLARQLADWLAHHIPQTTASQGWARYQQWVRE
jgi:BirA family transcriptional regulator, biotin operon repressor / biotin---[acetyl-CoA-carboxylase] ligase